ncbi:probable hexosyltransferase MUCI70 [Carya illinoinensis]|uniref:TOD1/MUCI70 glycosyltransferase-like domain-containing protein n=2 Tax=Carya illinoinensis TaxID=32201 RepID=A0A8T1NDE9_CARIL|nr:probable hexosyltransferase MUCI70 [Carya illinoinensis]XP_042962798.1 probable hexosyltransferase MUCI70 [Carya illinoinensis]KAG6626863.1 hypothetical protein CIPAW_15G081900 [Carya illinoinensis]
MAQHRLQSGADRFIHHSSSNGTPDHVSIGIRAAPSHKQSRSRRSARSDWGRRVSFGAVIVILSLVLVVTVLAYYYLSSDTRDVSNAENEGLKNDDFLTNVTRTHRYKVLKFGQGSIGHGRDSRYWDRDDRRRDEDYNEDVVEHSSEAATNEASDKGDVPTTLMNGNKKSSLDDSTNGSDRRGVGLYNEAGRSELKVYEAQYKASLEDVGQISSENGNSNQLFDAEDLKRQTEMVDTDDEYDDGFGFHDGRNEDYDDNGHGKGDHFDESDSHNEDVGDSRESSDLLNAGDKNQNVAEVDEKSTNSYDTRNYESVKTKSRRVRANGKQYTRTRSDSKRKAKRRSCEMKFLNSTAQLVEPLESRKFARFTLQYTEVEEKPNGQEQWDPRFAGHQSLEERENSFFAHDQKINCGLVKGPEGSPSTGFDLAEDDVNYISKCHIAVISCIFGNSDRLRTPTGKTVTRLSRKNVCFVMFMDEVTMQTLASEGLVLDRMGFIGLWKVVVVKNLPYSDMRRVGKIPKLLPHRLFPSARYSIWLDSKLRLQFDPLLILEYFLWRKGYEYAISNHYDRHCVWEEVSQNKKLNKYNHTIIDEQFAFYQADGLKRFNASDPNKLLPSNVPEGSFIIRAHTPMSNLFSCLWFNEVDRFTPRDQLSFAYTYQKLRRENPGKTFHLNMFKDCERRAIAKLFHHRSEEKRNIRQSATE